MLAQQVIDEHEGGLGGIMVEGADANTGARGCVKMALRSSALAVERAHPNSDAVIPPTKS